MHNAPNLFNFESPKLDSFSDFLNIIRETSSDEGLKLETTAKISTQFLNPIFCVCFTFLPTQHRSFFEINPFIH